MTVESDMADVMRQGGGFFTGRLFWLYWFPLILYGLALFVQSCFPPPQQLPKIHMGDKVMHFFAYAIMGGLFFRALLVTWPRRRPAWIVFYSVLFTTLYGVLDEIHQSFVASRTADQMDVFADFLGGSFGAICFCMVMGFLGRQRSENRGQKSEVRDQPVLRHAKSVATEGGRSEVGGQRSD